VFKRQFLLFKYRYQTGLSYKIDCRFRL